MALTVAAKMKVHTSLTDVPTALTDHRTIGELGYSMWDTDRNINKGLMNESTIRFMVGKYQPQELIANYNRTVQKHIFPHMNISANIHMLDCTDIEVSYENENYEGSGVLVEEIWKSPAGFGELSAQRYPIYKRTRGYSLGVLRGIVGDSGIIEEVVLSPINSNDLKVCEDMLLTSRALKPGDILINDRGFMDRSMINFLRACLVSP